MRAPVVILFAIVAVVAAAWPRRACARVNPLYPVVSETVEGGLAAAATCIHGATNQDGGPDGGTLRLQGVPVGAEVTRAILYWSVLSSDPPVPVGAPTFDGVPLVPVRLGELPETPCFDELPNTATFRADVTHLVAGNGEHALAGFPLRTGRAPVFTEGATLLVVWRLAGSPQVAVVIYEGIDVVDAPDDVATQVMTRFTATGAGSTAARFVAVLGNGQAFEPDALLFNGFDLARTHADLLDGSACPGELYDLSAFDVASLVPRGATSATFEVPLRGDCFTLAAAALSVRGVATCSPHEPSAVDLRPTVQPLRAARRPDGATILWWENSGDGHQVWRGSIGSWYDHAAVACDLVASWIELPQEPGSHYFLVAGCGPHAVGGRDSYGRAVPSALQASGSGCP